MLPAKTRFTCLDQFCIADEPPANYKFFPRHGDHILDVDGRLPATIPSLTMQALSKRFNARLADIVANDQAALLDERIDEIRVGDGGPTPEMWSMFDGLNPRHLSLDGGYGEDCDLDPLQSMKRWNRLETLHLGGICDGALFRLPPFVLRTLKSLELHMCMNIDIRPMCGASSTMWLESLYLHSNDVGVSAARVLKNFPSVKGTLTHLTIHSNGCGYDTEKERTGIRRVLQECSSLVDVKLCLRLHHALDVAEFLPASLRNLDFSGERSMRFLPQIGDWISRAMDDKWVPNLRHLTFTVDRQDTTDPGRFFGTGEQDDFEEEPWADEVDAQAPRLFDSNDQPNANDRRPCFDADPELFRHRHRSQWWSLAAPPDDSFEDVDLENIPGIGPHPNHSPTPRNEFKRASVADDDLAKFEEAFEAKKRELFYILRQRRPEVDLV